MEEDTRPNPDDLLAALQKQEQAEKTGKLKIFLGMAAGVGKTYAMLKEARELKEQGVDVVVGIVDTHQRQETAELLQGLEIIAEKSINYKEKSFKELDVEAILLRNPSIVLVDELAHDNIPGSKHAKRWQDVMEILNQSIDVYTTLNVQHIESLNDIVREITEIAVRETVPDQVIERADSIRIVDLTPGELLERLKEGKVYLAGQSQIAILHFFQPDRLAALRQIALRYVADKVDRDLKKLLPTLRGPIEWRPREKILVPVSHSPHSQKLIRIAKRLTVSMDATWIAIHVDQGVTYGPKETDQLSRNLTLARDLGAEVLTIYDSDIAEGIQRIANQRTVTQIILGRSNPRLFQALFGGFSLVDKLAKKCKHIDIHIIRGEKYQISTTRRWPFFSPNETLSSYGLVCFFVALFTAINYLLFPYIGHKIVGLIFLLGILSLSLFFKKGPIFFASILYALIWSFFIPMEGPSGSPRQEDLVLLTLYPLTALIVAVLVDRARKQKESLIKSEKTTLALYEIVKNFSSNLSREEMLDYVKERLAKFIDGFYEFKIKDNNDKIELEEAFSGNEKEKRAALWCYENGKDAGWSTEILPHAENLYIPLKASHQVMGILIFRPKNKKMMTTEERVFLYTVSQQLSNFLERLFMIEQEKQNEYFKQVDKIHRTILVRISHAFQQPIMATQRALGDLKKGLASRKEDIAMLLEIEGAFDSFVGILSNISAMAQLSEGMVPLRKSHHQVREIFTECCDNARKSCRGQRIETRVADALPPLYIDYYLIQILLHNLIINAINHAPIDSTILIEASKADPFIKISISNEGISIPQDQLQAIFEKFYRLPDEKTPGIGLGLAIAKTIAELHEGVLTAENHPTKGTCFSLLLPMEN